MFGHSRQEPRAYVPTPTPTPTPTTPTALGQCRIVDLPAFFEIADENDAARVDPRGGRWTTWAERMADADLGGEA